MLQYQIRIHNSYQKQGLSHKRTGHPTAPTNRTTTTASTLHPRARRTRGANASHELCAPSPCTRRSMATAPAAPGGLMHLRPPPPRCVLPRASASRSPRIWSPLPRLRLRRRRALALAAPSVAAAEAEAYTEPELVLLEALLGVQGRGRAVAPRQLHARDSRFTRPMASAPRAC